MESFLSKVVSDVLKKKLPLTDTTFVLPNKRSGLFLKNILKERLHQNTFLPKILSIEEFIKQIAGFEILDNVQLIFEFYGIYKNLGPKAETDSFENFSKWASLLIQDFNELDSNLFDSHSILSYLSDSKRIEQWDPGNNPESALVNNYLAFFNKITAFHDAFKAHLMDKKVGYQGLVYKIASSSMDSFIDLHKNEHFVFAAFNALSKSEEIIFQELLANKLASVYWDHDEFYEKSNNQAEQFFKKYLRTWPYYSQHPFSWKKQHINKTKTIHFCGLPKNISQIKHVGTILRDLNRHKGIKDTAVILGNEKLLPTLLNSIPKEIPKANITMGYDLQHVPLNTFFQALFKLHLNKSKWKKRHSFYYKDLISLLYDPFFQQQWSAYPSIDEKFHNVLYKDKTMFISEELLLSLVEEDNRLSSLFQSIFTGWDTETDLVIEKIVVLITTLREKSELNKIDQEYLFRYYNIFQQLSNLNKNYGFIEDVPTLFQIFQQILKTEKLSFQGEPLEGLQIMGLLESRGLDFRNLIITSVNEGFLPATGANNSFIPLDIKLEKKMPTFLEKDAIFSYHFYRLLHRADNVFLIYNNITDDFGSGEPSRFIKQLEIAKALGQLDQVRFEKRIIHPKMSVDPIELQSVNKTEDVLNQLKKLASKGISPSSLIKYIRDPLDFYKRKVLRIKEYREVEETVANFTFGTIVHDTLEKLYTPYLEQKLELEDVKQMMQSHEEEVSRQFKKNYTSSSITTGKNFLALEIAKQFVLNFLQFEMEELKAGHEIILKGLEVEIETEHFVNELGFDIKLQGKIDRIDEVDGILRITDYKTGKVSQNQLKINDWSLITTQEKYDKSFQVLIYAYMYLKASNLTLAHLLLTSGIISLKNLKEGFMAFNKGVITEETMESFINEMDKLLIEIFDAEIPFKEKELSLTTY